MFHVMNAMVRNSEASFLVDKVIEISNLDLVKGLEEVVNYFNI